MSKSNTQATENSGVNQDNTQATVNSGVNQDNTQATVNSATTQDNTQATVNSVTTRKPKKDPGEELVELFIPKKSRDDTERFLAVNGENVMVQTGVTVKVKRKFKEVYDNSVAQEAAAEEFISNNINK